MNSALDSRSGEPPRVLVPGWSLRACFVIATLAAGLLAPVARSEEAAPIDTVIHSVYDVISGPAGARDWARFRSLFADGARLISMRMTPAGPSPAVMTVEDYVQRAGASFEKSGFYESEAARRSEVFGNIAHVFSTYESRHAPGEKPFARGINSFQLVKEGAGWKVMTILWDSERDGSAIPEKYLPPQAPGVAR